MDDFEKLINASDLIEWIMETYPDWCVGDVRSIVDHVIDLPSAQPEQPPEIQDILNYLDTVLHPIVSPEHWDVYADLHDMVSALPSAHPEPMCVAKVTLTDEQVKEAFEKAKGEIVAVLDAQPERKKGKWIDEGFYADGHGAHAFRCSECGGHIIEYDPDPFCRWCGADMREEAQDATD